MIYCGDKDYKKISIDDHDSCTSKWKSVTFEEETKYSCTQSVYDSQQLQTNWIAKKDLKNLEKIVNDGKPLRSADKDREVIQNKKYREVIAREKKKIEWQAKEVKEEKTHNKTKGVEFTPLLPKYDGIHETVKPHDVLFLMQRPHNKPAPRILKTEKRPLEMKTDAFFGNVPQNNVRTRTYYTTTNEVPFIPYVSGKSLRPRPASRVSSALARSVQVSPTPHLLASRRRSLCSACSERPASPKPSKPPTEHSPKLQCSSQLSSYYGNAPPEIALLRSILPSESSKLLQVGRHEAYMSLCPPFVARKFTNMGAKEDSISDSATTSNVTLESLDESGPTHSNSVIDMTTENITTEPPVDNKYESNTKSNSLLADDEAVIEKHLVDDKGGEYRRKEHAQCKSFKYLELSHVPMKYSKTVRKGNDTMIVTLTVSSREDPKKRSRQKETTVMDSSAKNEALMDGDKLTVT